MATVLNISRIQRFSVDDGPGIRSTVFVKGCNLRCRWCHNPENLTTRPVLQYKDSSCLRCRLCQMECPAGSHIFTEAGHTIDRSKCISCGACASVCLNHSLELVGRKWKMEEILEEVVKDKDYYDVSGGGVTFSGGEPMLDPGPLSEVLKECRKQGLHTAVDTAGNVPFSAFEQVLPYTDLFLYDIKCITPELHERGTGVRNEQILENARRLREQKVKMWVRTPLIPGFNMEEKEIQSIREFVSGVLNAEVHDELPYHDYGVGKYQMLGMDMAQSFGRK